MRDAFRLVVGTLTVVPTAPPRVVDRVTGAAAMAFAPVVGGLLALPALMLLWLLGWIGAAPLDRATTSPLLTAAIVVVLLVALTRGIHLDGAADTADGLGSGRAPEGALEVMRAGDVGPFGVATVVLLLLLQVTALGEVLGSGEGAVALAVALVASRLALPMLCSRGVPAARPDGLGRLVAGTVGVGRLLASTALALGAAALLGGLVAGPDPSSAVSWETAVRGGIAAVVGLAAAGALGLRCVRRLGGVTGDVLGAGVELSFTVTLVVWAVQPG